VIDGGALVNPIGIEMRLRLDHTGCLNYLNHSAIANLFEISKNSDVSNYHVNSLSLYSPRESSTMLFLVTSASAQRSSRGIDEDFNGFILLISIIYRDTVYRARAPGRRDP
jgi:hypothetical protein